MSLRAGYLKDGYCTPLDIFSPDEVDELYRGYRKYVKTYGTPGEGVLVGDLRFRLHVVAKWARDIIFAPKLVAAVKEILDTDDLLCWDSDLNIKTPGSDGFFSWHQDGTYSGHSPASGVVTAWVALSPATPESGCLQFRPGSHQAQLPHEETKDPNNLLAVGQTIPIDDMKHLQAPVVAPLRPGQVHCFVNSSNEVATSRFQLHLFCCI